ncbi:MULTISPECIES: hypothetical protein [Citricoccus]|uniref:DUF3180 family protein n=1 Tax=Citricoccus muralis TaxID=169134 RepID=A0ABY8H8V4_9MICC|nr:MULTISPECIES: hypothetical protein [Citricoccus]WBL19334.1 hypothetical protein O1A05_01080 [Citricoccus sp. NR2]WFP17042.1 hypothetical protein P8192_02645 [Citricoccus muralis]
MSKHVDAKQQRTALIILSAMTVVLLYCLHIAGAFSGPLMTAIVWFFGMGLAAFLLLKAVLPLLADHRG